MSDRIYETTHHFDPPSPRDFDFCRYSENGWRLVTIIKDSGQFICYWEKETPNE